MSLKWLIGDEVRGTKNNPFTLHYLIKALSIADNTTTTKTIEYSPKVLSGKGIRGLKGISTTGKVYEFTGKCMKKGNVKMFTLKTGDLLSTGTCFTNVYRENVLKSIEEFPSFSKVKEVGTIKDHDKGGWYSHIPLYQLEGTYYAPFECSQTMNAAYSEDAGL